MKPEKLRTIFIHWLNTALQDARWRAFIRARLKESELPVIELANQAVFETEPGRNHLRDGEQHVEKVREELVINFSD